MNYKYILELLKRNRTGKVIKILKDNVFDWSVRDYVTLFSEISGDIYSNGKMYFDIFYFMMENMNINKRTHIRDYFLGFGYNTQYRCIWRQKQKQNHDVTRYMLKIVNVPTELALIKTLTYIILKNKNYDVLKYCVSLSSENERMNIIENNELLFGELCEKNYVDMVKYLMLPIIINKYPNICPCYKNHYALRYSVERNNDALEYLLSDEVQEKYPELTIENLSSYHQEKYNENLKNKDYDSNRYVCYINK